LGYVYQNGGIHSSEYPMHTMLPNEIAHWSPLPDPQAAGIGMSWLTPALREIQGDRAATEHKLRFFENGATPNMVVNGLSAASRKQFDEIVDAMEGRHKGLRNAYRTLYLTAGADAKVVGSDLKQLDFKNTQGAGETRIAFLSRVPAPILGIAEGLAGSSLNAGNFGMARRIFADSWVYPTLQDLCASLASIINVPRDAELWFDVTDMPLLREDARDAAEIMQIQGQTITNYVREGFTPESSIAAVNGNDVNLLKHSGLVSVQLYEPGATQDNQGHGLPPITKPVIGNSSGGKPNPNA
jgi:phage portal protein BeeE